MARYVWWKETPEYKQVQCVVARLGIWILKYTMNVNTAALILLTDDLGRLEAELRRLGIEPPAPFSDPPEIGAEDKEAS